MPIENLGHEYEFEPQFGLPERLPEDEFIVWQGSPDAGALATSAFHLKKLGFYFAALRVPQKPVQQGFQQSTGNAIAMHHQCQSPVGVLGAGAPCVNSL